MVHIYSLFLVFAGNEGQFNDLGGDHLATDLDVHWSLSLAVGILGVTHGNGLLKDRAEGTASHVTYRQKSSLDLPPKK